MDYISDLEVCQSSVTLSADQPAVAQGLVRGAGGGSGVKGWKGLRKGSQPYPSTLALTAGTIWTTSKPLGSIGPHSQKP